MTPARSSPHPVLDALATAGDPRRFGVFLDFDGTLADIVVDPATARPVAGAVDVLASLTERFGVVAVVSGRPVMFLHEHLPVPPSVRMVGLYGLQHWHNGEVREDRDASRWREAVEGGAARAEMELPKEVHVERKGLSFVLHYRRAPAFRGLVEEWAARYAAASGLDAERARSAVEIGPFRHTDKGTVVAHLSKGLRGAVAFGDDIGDMASFEAVRSMGPEFAAACVAVRSGELPPSLAEEADLVVEGPGAVVEQLRLLVELAS